MGYATGFIKRVYISKDYKSWNCETLNGTVE